MLFKVHSLIVLQKYALMLATLTAVCFGYNETFDIKNFIKHWSAFLCGRTLNISYLIVGYPSCIVRRKDIS